MRAFHSHLESVVWAQNVCLAPQSRVVVSRTQSRFKSKDWSTVYQLFFDLLPFTQDSHRLRNDHGLFRAYGYAEWCLHQKSKDLWNAAGVCFYEDPFDEQDKWDEVIPWLSPYVIAECSSLWQTHL